MKISVDKEGAQVIQGLCDIALKSLGIQGLKDVTRILESVRVDEEPADKSEPPPKA